MSIEARWGRSEDATLLSPLIARACECLGNILHSPSTDAQKCVGRLAHHRAASAKVGHAHRHDLVGEPRADASLVNRALALHVLREKLPDITEVTWLMGTQ